MSNSIASRRRPVPSVARLALFTLSAAALAISARAGQTWIPLVDGAPPGKPAEISIDPIGSTAQRTIIAVKIHGFFTEKKKGPDGIDYDVLEFPGLPSIGQIGAPSLPAVRFKLGIATSAAAAQLTKIDVLDSKTIPGLLVWPETKSGASEDVDPSEDPGPGDSDGVAEEFVKDPAIYALNTPWPASPADPAPKVMASFGPTKAADCDCQPVTWNPGKGSLLVASHVRYSYDHGGVETKLPPLTKDKGKLMSEIFVNFDELTEDWPINHVKYDARYLIVTHAAFAPAMAPFVAQKKKQGFQVTLTTVATGVTATQVRQAIASWYAAGSSSYDHYCLLVGDTDVIPQRFKGPIGYDGGDVWSDDEYGSPTDLDLDEEVYVGRLSVDGVTDLEQQIAKILDYENTPAPGGNYERAILVGHKGNSGAAPSGFEMSLDVIKNADYAVEPTFHTVYGNYGGTNTTIFNWFFVGIGVLCYEGHGSSNAFSGWYSDSFHKNQVIALGNYLMQPVVWSLTCSNMNLQLDPGSNHADCIGETWMETPGTGAAASYGSTTISWVKQNHKLAQHLFEAVYDKGLTRHGQAIAWAEAKAKQDWPSMTNVWMYLLLGDPAMHVRRGPPPLVIADFPAVAPLCQGCFDVDFTVKLPSGAPLPGALVALWKPAAGNAFDVGGEDEVFVNAYTDAQGKVTLPVSPQTTGVIHYTVRSDETMLLQGTIDVAPCANPASNLAYGAGKPGTFGVPSLTAPDLPKVGEVTTIEIGNGKPGALPVLILGSGMTSLPFDGGMLLVNPQILIPVPVPIGANGKLAIQGTLPDDPALCGAKLFHQVIFTDPGATGFYHQAMTNGLLRVFGS